MIAALRPAWGRLDGLSKTLLAGVVLLLLPLLYLVCNNLPADFSLDRAQYEHLAQIARVYDGQPIYVPMTFEFSPITYTPLYWLVCGWLWKLTGPGFLTPQLVTLLCSLAVFVCLARWLWTATDRDLFLTGMGVFAMVLISLFTVFWLFQISVDAMHFAWTIWGFYFLRRTDAKGVMLAAVALSLGALSKQTGLAYVAAGGAYVLLKAPRSAPAFLAAALVVCGGGLGLIQILSGGQFYDIVVRENQGPFWDAARLLNEVWGAQFLSQTGLLLLFSLWPLAAGKGLLQKIRLFLAPEYVMAAAGLVVASIAQPKFGSGNNHAVIAMAGLIVCGYRGVQAAGGLLREPALGQALRQAVVVLQTLALLIPAWSFAAPRFIDRIDRLRYDEIANVFRKGPTVLYHFPYITRSFGYPEGGHQGNENCRWIDGRWSWANKPAFLSEPYRQQRYDYVILCASVIDQGDPTIQAIMANYSMWQTLPAHPVRPNTLMLRYPLYILRANRLAPASKPPGS